MTIAFKVIVEVLFLRGKRVSSGFFIGSFVSLVLADIFMKGFEIVGLESSQYIVKF